MLVTIGGRWGSEMATNIFWRRSLILNAFWVPSWKKNNNNKKLGLFSKFSLFWHRISVSPVSKNDKYPWADASICSLIHFLQDVWGRKQLAEAEDVLAEYTQHVKTFNAGLEKCESTTLRGSQTCTLVSHWRNTTTYSVHWYRYSILVSEDSVFTSSSGKLSLCFAIPPPVPHPFFAPVMSFQYSEKKKCKNIVCYLAIAA